MKISHVCRRWRECALEWPVLWGSLNLNRPRSIVELFVNRSENAPLTLSWTIHEEPISRLEALNPSTRLYLISCKKLILPRLYSLILHFDRSQSNSVQNVFHTSKMLRSLQYLDIRVNGSRASGPLSLNGILQIEAPFLRGLSLL